MGYVQDIHHFAVCDLCGKRQEIRESAERQFWVVYSPMWLDEKSDWGQGHLHVL